MSVTRTHSLSVMVDEKTYERLARAAKEEGVSIPRMARVALAEKLSKRTGHDEQHRINK